MEYRACMSSYIVFTVMCVPFIAGSVVLLVMTGQPSCLQMTAIASGAWLLSIYWLRRYRLAITADTVTYASLLARERRIARADIIHADFAESTGATESPLTFVIRTKDGTEVRVNAKVFSHEAVQALVGLNPP
jgi:hypothetical protein